MRGCLWVRAGFISGVHLWLVKVVNLSEPDSIFIGVCRGCMPLDQDPQDLRDRCDRAEGAGCRALVTGTGTDATITVTNHLYAAESGWFCLQPGKRSLLLHPPPPAFLAALRTYYLSNGVIRVGGRRVATNAANFTKGDVVGVVLDADQGEIVFFRNGVEQGRARGIRGRCVPWGRCSCVEWASAKTTEGAAHAGAK